MPVLLAVLSGICFGSWSLALKRARKVGFDAFFAVWYGTVFGVVSAGCFVAGGAEIPGRLGSADLGSLAWGIGGGLGWGVATLTFGYALTLVGLALGYAIILGIGMVVGTSISMMLPSGVAQGLQVNYGIMGMLVALGGTLLSAYSGRMKSGDMEGRKNFRKGIPVCVISGLLSSLFAIGYGGARTNLGTWGAILLLVAGFWAAQLISLAARSARGKSSLKVNGLESLLPVAGGAIFAAGVLLHYASADVVGVALSYPMMMGIQILTGNLWSIGLGEWKSAPRKALALQILSLAMLMLASTLIGRSMLGS
ncbi:MAG: hypothetical protein QW567_01140 [Candidatus Hadarchaeales archaeon]